MSKQPDVVVIGSGVIGCAVADALVRRGALVEVVDGRGVASGATQASAGMLVPYIEGHDHGPQLELGVRSLSLYDAFVERTIDGSGQAVPYSRSGSLQAAFTEEAVERMKGDATSLAAARVRHTLLDRTAALNMEPQLAEDVAAGLFIDDHGFVGATALTRALAASAARQGVRFSIARARRLTAESGGVRIDLDEGSRSTGTVVLAAGSWSGTVAIDGVPPLSVRPVRGQLLHLGWPEPPLRRVTWGSHCYLVPWDDGSLLVGATVEEAGFDERATVAGVHDLLDAAAELVPRAWKASFVGVRVGLRPATPDDLPIIGASRRIPGLVYATGHFRNGVLLSPLTALLVADVVLDRATDPLLAITSPQRFGDL